MKHLILFLSIAYSSLSLFAQTTESKIIDKKSNGPYKSIAVSDRSLPDYVIYRPKNLKQLKKKSGNVPLFIFANGGCNDTSIPYERYLSEMASHGYMVIALGSLQKEINDREIKKTEVNMIPKAIDWMLSQNADKNSEYYDIISTDKIAIGGHSCGGADALSVASDPRVKTYMMFNSGMGDMSMFGATPKSINNIHAPVIYIAGGPSDIAYENAKKDFERISHVPVVFSNLIEGGHSGTFEQKYGGDFTRMTLDWFDFIFKGENKSDLFVKGNLKDYPGWSLSSKNFNKDYTVKSSDLQKSEIRPELVSKIDSTLKYMVESGKINCVSAFVAKSGDIVYNNSFGYRDMAKKEPASVDDYYVMFSQTKAITTVAFMTLVEQGLVAVNDPVSKYLPEISNEVVVKVNDDGTYTTRPASTPMTFAHLMSHTSGLNSGEVKKIRQIEMSKKKTDNAVKIIVPGQHSFGDEHHASLASNMQSLLSYPLGFDPGSQWDYHISTNMLGYLIEIISGMPVRDYIKQYVLEPLEMNDTDWYFSSDKASRFVMPYDYVDGKLIAGNSSFGRNAIGDDYTYCEATIGLNGPVGDYAKFCQMLLNKGEFRGRRILKPENVELMTTVNHLPESNSGGKGFKFGLGFELYNEHKRPVQQVSPTAFAWAGMMGTEYIIDPENDLIALFYLNMFKKESMYPLFLEQVYDAFK